MTMIDMIKKVTDSGCTVEFSKRLRTIPPTISMVITPENAYGGYEFVFLPNQWTEKDIIQGIDCLVNKIEEDKKKPKNRELYWSHNND